MRFTKMHGIGNDYVFVDCFTEAILQPEKIARIVSDRHFGIGSDGLILIKPSVSADFEMAMYNADGSKGQMCGNGIRCMAKYVYEKGLTDKTCITIETLAGIRRLWLTVEREEVVAVKVDMGAPIWEPERIPMCYESKTTATEKTDAEKREFIIDKPLWLDDRKWMVTCLSMGNPHCVIFMEEAVTNISIEEIGYKLEHHTSFPAGANIEFVNVKSKEELIMRVWERGSGETLACGTGACAVMAAANINGYVGETVFVQLPGGTLEVFWDKKENHIYMTGTAVSVYEGDFILPQGVK